MEKLVVNGKIEEELVPDIFSDFKAYYEYVYNKLVTLGLPVKWKKYNENRECFIIAINSYVMLSIDKQDLTVKVIGEECGDNYAFDGIYLDLSDLEFEDIFMTEVYEKDNTNTVNELLKFVVSRIEVICSTYSERSERVTEDTIEKMYKERYEEE